MKLVVTFPVPQAAKELLSQHAELQCWDVEDAIPVDLLTEWLSNADGVLTTLTCPLGAGVLANAAQLKVISTVSVGVDHIDLNAAARHGILVGHTPNVLTDNQEGLQINFLYHHEI